MINIGLNRPFVDDARLNTYTVLRNCSTVISVSSTPSILISSENQLMPYYLGQTAYFMNSTANMIFTLEEWNFNSENKTIEKVKEYKVPVKGLGIPCSFSQTYKVAKSFVVATDFVGWIAKYADDALYSLADLEGDGLIEYTTTENRIGIDLIESEYNNHWENRMAGDLMDMAFYIESII